MEVSDVPTLTPRQREVLDFIASKPVPPTVREIAARFGLNSPNGAMAHIRALERKGLLTREPGTMRNIRIVNDDLPLLLAECRALCPHLAERIDVQLRRAGA